MKIVSASRTTEEDNRYLEALHAREIERERKLSSTAEFHAAELVKIADKLRWGDGTAAGCAAGYLVSAAAKAGIPWYGYHLSGDLPVSAREIFDRDDWTCQICGTRRNLTVDHIIARANGGTDDPGNLQTLCMPCNARKGAA